MSDKPEWRHVSSSSAVTYLFVRVSNMALCHYPCPEEIDVFTGPHMRMKQLVYEALEKVGVYVTNQAFLFGNRAVFWTLRSSNIL